MEHLCGRSPVCLRICRFKVEANFVRYGQNEHAWCTSLMQFNDELGDINVDKILPVWFKSAKRNIV